MKLLFLAKYPPSLSPSHLYLMWLTSPSDTPSLEVQYSSHCLTPDPQTDLEYHSVKDEEGGGDADYLSCIEVHSASMRRSSGGPPVCSVFSSHEPLMETLTHLLVSSEHRFSSKFHCFSLYLCLKSILHLIEAMWAVRLGYIEILMLILMRNFSPICLSISTQRV